MCSRKVKSRKCKISPFTWCFARYLLLFLDSLVVFVIVWGWESSSVSPAVRDGDDVGLVFGDLEEHGQVEVGAGRVAPPAVVAGLLLKRRSQ
ncbi:hypothetical protein PS2_012194 [Malus domestica]